MKIDTIEFGQYPLFLAPMEDVTDAVFRSFCKRFGADMMYTEFVSADALIRDIEKTKLKLELRDEERPVAIQIYGKEIDTMVEAAKIAELANPDIIDINFGCPVKKIASKGAGSGMLRDVPKMVDMTAQIVKAVNKPVTVKTRLGWDDQSKHIVEIAERLQDTGIKALTIHGRTRAQMYTGDADWTLIGQVKNNPRMYIPIIGNGDVDNAQITKQHFNNYGVDAVMIGRATIGRPWIFRDIKHFLQTGEELLPMTIVQHVALIEEMVDKAVEWLGEYRGLLHMRRHMAVTFKALPHFRPLKIRMLQTHSHAELKQIFREIETTYATF